MVYWLTRVDENRRFYLSQSVAAVERIATKGELRLESDLPISQWMSLWPHMEALNR